MKLFSWNCRGLGKPQAVRALKKLLLNHNPDIAMLMETKLQAQDRVLSKMLPIGLLTNSCVIDCNISGGGRAGGIMLLWNNDVTLNIANANKNFFDFYIRAPDNSMNWRATGIYGFPSSNAKTLTCDLIKDLYQLDTHSAWLVFGDLNLVLNQNEKFGGNPIDLNVTSYFKSTLFHCELDDIGSKGSTYTWANNHEDDTFIMARLDRFLANDKWKLMFPEHTNSHLLRFRSDHNPLLLDFNQHDFQRNKKLHKSKVKRMEKIWIQDQDCHKLIKDTWNSTLGDSNCRLFKVLNSISDWGHSKFGDHKSKIRELQDQLAKLKLKVPPDPETNQLIIKIEKDLDENLRLEELWWSQRAKTRWLKEGDRNTAYFHQKASDRKKRNWIRCLTTPEGTITHSEEDIYEIFNNYFQDIFKTDNTAIPRYMLEGVKDKVTADMKIQLEQPYTLEEVTITINQMNSTAAPGPDGCPALFFQRFWDIIGTDVSTSILNILNNQFNPDCFNKTFICLIPKINSPNVASDFRPIALCNVMLKIITKTIANRIKPILSYIISPYQSAFVPGRLITNNVLLAFETFHKLHLLKNRKKGFIGLKLDMAKAYDRLEWNFIEATLIIIGFPTNMVNIIMKCIRSVKFSILINGHATDYFSPQRGIRQGDPLSPYLFILCAEVLSSMITQSQIAGNLTGLAIAKNDVPITHLLFVDDSLMFCRADEKDAEELNSILVSYQKAFGQKINLEKSELMFSKNVGKNKRAAIQRILGIPITDKIKKYLGLLTYIGKAKNQMFQALAEKIWKKLKSWKQKKLSFAGRSILIKAVAQAIPTYMMSCFQIPVGIYNQMERIICRFWWGQKGEEKKMHWTKWSNLCKTKQDGGLGFRTLKDFNEAMLAKQGWRLLTNPDTPLAKSLKAKYYPNCHFLKSKPGHQPSYSWRSINQAKWILEKGCYWNIGNGESINIKEDNWIPYFKGLKVLSQNQLEKGILLVKDLLDKDNKWWKEDVIDRNFISLDREAILQIPITNMEEEDNLCWMGTKDGAYTVKSGYYSIKEWKKDQTEGTSNPDELNSFWNKIWKVRAPPRQQMLIWRILNDIIPVRRNLSNRGINYNIVCPRCKEAEESIEHCFKGCL